MYRLGVMGRSDVGAVGRLGGFERDRLSSEHQRLHDRDHSASPVRLWIAARNADWPFAAYELGNLKGAFDRLGLAHPTDHEIPLRDLISSVTTTPFEDLHKAIESKDTAAFAKAYDDLTSACNACHQATNHSVVVIRAPTDASLSDQDFVRQGP
jgi:hypothetical protein